MKSFDIRVSLLLLLVAVSLIALANAHPLDGTDLLPQSEDSPAASEDSLELEADKGSSYDDEIVSHVVEIVNLALDALQS